MRYSRFTGIMSYCINPNCLKPQNNEKLLFCLGCGSELLLQGCYQVTCLLSNPNKPSGFGTIYEVNDNGTPKILKVLHNNHSKAVELFRQEAEVLQRLNHRGIPRVDDYFEYEPRNGSPLHCLVMEKIEGMNLEEWLEARNNKPIIEHVAISWLKQLVEILHEVHQQQYFHRDIKPANIMLRPDGQLVLIDFGTAREVTQTFMQKKAGQQITGIVSAGCTPLEQSNGKAVPQSDFFALGRTFVYLLTGQHPIAFSEDTHTGELIWRDNATQISPTLAGLIDYLMKPFPGNRPKNTQEILQHLHEIENNLHSSISKTQTSKNTVVISPKTLTGQSKIKWLTCGAILLLGIAGLYYTFYHFLIYQPTSTSSQTPTSSPLEPFANQPSQSSRNPSEPITSAPISPPNTRTNCTSYLVNDREPPLNVRIGPGLEYEVIDKLENGTPLSVVYKPNGEQGWFQIDSPVKGWLAGNRTKPNCNR